MKLLLNPSVLAPGGRLEASALLTSTSETPVDYVAVSLRGWTRIGIGQGKSRRVYEQTFFLREWRAPAFTMTPGEHRFNAEFDLPDHGAPSYTGPDTLISYTMTVEVAIPWWPDRVQDFIVPVAFAPAPAPERRPERFVTSSRGPRGKDPFMELSLDATQVVLGDALAGSVSLQNLRGKRIRGVDLSIVELEGIRDPAMAVREGRRFTRRVFDGAPEEGAAVPFRVLIPETATPTFESRAPTHSLHVTTHIEVRAEVAWGKDIGITAPIHVGPKAIDAHGREQGRVAPVGLQRAMMVWHDVAARSGLTSDPEAHRMFGRVGDVTVEVFPESRDDYWLVAKLAWPSLGLDLEVTERSWSDALAVDVVKSGDANLDARLCVHAREHAQAKVLATPEVLGWIKGFAAVTIEDTGARLAVRGAAQVRETLETFVGGVLAAASILDDVRKKIPPPILFADDVPAWEALAARIRGRLELGRMWIHKAQVGTSTVDIGTVWARGGLLLGSTVIVAMDPPLDPVPAGTDDPALSPAARDLWRELTTEGKGKVKSVQVEAAAITLELEGQLADPHTAMPLVEHAVSLHRALVGNVAAGPFR